MIIKSMSFKHQIVRILLIGEVIIILFFLLLGSQGFITMRSLKNELKKIEQNIIVRELEIKNLENEYSEWESDPFYIERYAREKLAMARDGDIIYVIKE